MTSSSVITSSRIKSNGSLSSIYQHPEMVFSLSAPTHTPILRCSLAPSSKLISWKPTSALRSKVLSFGAFDPLNGRSRASGQPRMLKGSAFRSGGGNGVGGDDGVRAFEQEAFLGSNFSEFMADGLEPTLNRLSKWLVLVIFGSVILWKHNAESMWAAMGAVVNATLSAVLKRILNQERPIPTRTSDPGMPSSHAQIFFFMVVFAICSIIEWLGVNGWSLSISVLLLAMCTYFSWLRVSQQYHTLSQVAVGALVGAAFSGLWYWSWEAFVLEAYNSHLWVRISIILCAVGFCVAFLVYVARNWFKDDR